MKNVLIILAGGRGLRMKTKQAKQFIRIDGKTILQHTLDLFLTHKPELEVVLALAESEHQFWLEETATWKFRAQITLAKGGKERFFSVKNALNHINGPARVFIHDAVRPVLSEAFLSRIFELESSIQAAIPIVPVVSSIRSKTSDGKTKAEDRSRFVEVQTPQVFDFELVKKAYSQAYNPCFTDDASVVEALGFDVETFDGESTNIKLTYAEDLERLKQRLS
ncbi:MAG: 2-C-methyl-D-erythritol 4-phosphate cytidylyltransferase [Flavobacteriales bacterium]